MGTRGARLSLDQAEIIPAGQGGQFEISFGALAADGQQAVRPFAFLHATASNRSIEWGQTAGRVGAAAVRNTASEIVGSLATTALVGHIFRPTNRPYCAAGPK